MDFKITHLLLFVVAIFLLYHLLGGCYNGVIDGFSVGGQKCENNCCGTTCATNEAFTDICNRFNNLNNKVDTITNKVDTITNRLDDLICQLVQSEKCITNQGASDCKNK